MRAHAFFIVESVVDWTLTYYLSINLIEYSRYLIGWLGTNYIMFVCVCLCVCVCVSLATLDKNLIGAKFLGFLQMNFLRHLKNQYNLFFPFFFVLFSLSSSSSSSSSCCAASTDILDPLSPLLLIVHCLWQVFRATSRNLT